MFFALSCLTSSSQNSFDLSLRPRRASTFFRKESRQRFAKELRPFEPHSCALRPIFSSSTLLAGLTALRAANRRLTGKRLKSQGAKLSFSSVSVRRRTSAPFRRSPPSFSLLAGLRGLSAANRRLMGKRPKSQGAELSFSGVSVRWGCAGAFAWLGFVSAIGNGGWASCLPGKTGAVRGPALGTNRVRARLSKGTNTVRDLPAAGARVCETRGRKRQGACLAHRRCAAGGGEMTGEVQGV